MDENEVFRAHAPDNYWDGTSDFSTNWYKKQKEKDVTNEVALKSLSHVWQSIFQLPLSSLADLDMAVAKKTCSQWYAGITSEPENRPSGHRSDYETVEHWKWVSGLLPYTVAAKIETHLQLKYEFQSGNNQNEQKEASSEKVKISDRPHVVYVFYCPENARAE
ncbi:hypothetical protein OT109_09350 [Phycisphaeraceae bacterium D3-23]